MISSPALATMRNRSVLSADRHYYIIIVAVAVAARVHGLFISSIDADEGVYLVIAQNWLLGWLPYVSVWDQHPPGLPALLAIVQNIVPDPVLGARLAAVVATMVTALLMHSFCVRYFHRPGVGLIAALLYIICISRWTGLVANTEVFNNACTTAAAYLLYGAARAPSAGSLRAVIAALILGVGLQIKYVIFPEAVMLCLGYLFASYRLNRDLRSLALVAGLLVLAGCFPTGIAILYFWLHGALRAFLEANIRSNVAYLQMMLPLASVVRFSASGIAPVVASILIAGYVMMRFVRRRSFAVLSPAAWILLWGAAAVIDVCLPLKFWPHYYFALYPPACIGGVLALCAEAENQRIRFSAGLVTLFMVAVVLWVRGGVWASIVSEADAPRDVAGFLRQAGARDLGVFVYNYEPVIYALARLRPPTPYVEGYEMTWFSESSNVNGVTEIQRVMDSSPDFVVLCAKSAGERVPDALDDLMEHRLATYHLVHHIQDKSDDCVARIYER
jgi:4-amino-4-deoxy-L-arabinose transferase-like glycosyltransferase